jgi:hypothetical protein
MNPVKWYGEINETQDTHEETAQTVINGKYLSISARTEQNNLTGELIVLIAEEDKETGKKELQYYYRKRFVGFGKDLEKKLSDAINFKRIEIELIARGEA